MADRPKLALLVLTVLTPIRAAKALLRSQFGAKYDACRVRTARLVPGIY